MECHPDGGRRINSFALVAYIPGPLGLFLTHLRNELVYTCSAQSHVTILPPRSLNNTPEQATKQLAEWLQDAAPFSVELTDVQVFPKTDVVYLAVGSGSGELLRMHDLLNRGHLQYDEPYPYHPHVTLAQEYSPMKDRADMENSARDRWSRFTGRRAFEVDRLTFVQNTADNQWLNLADFGLGDKVLSGVRG